jgi:hypothetical protein
VDEQAYYPFQAEKEILETYADEIACRMFGLPTSILRKDDGEEKEEKYKQSRPEKVGANKEKWFVFFPFASSPAILVLTLSSITGATPPSACTTTASTAA